MNKMQWEIKVPIFKNRFILKAVGLAIGIPFGVVIAIILFTAESDAKYALLFIGLLFLLAFVLILIIYGGKYAAGFAIDDTGIVNYTQAKHARRSNTVNKLAVVLGAVSGKPAAMGAGMIAQSKQVVHIKWKNIRKVKYYPKQFTILIKGGFTENIAVFCTRENYAEVEAIIKNRAKGK